MHARPQRGVGRVFADHGVVTMNWMVSVLLCTSSSGGMVNSASASRLSEPPTCPGVAARWQTAFVHDQLEMAELRQQAGEKA